jgi:hypothetical protein
MRCPFGLTNMYFTYDVSIGLCEVFSSEFRSMLRKKKHVGGKFEKEEAEEYHRITLTIPRKASACCSSVFALHMQSTRRLRIRGKFCSTTISSNDCASCHAYEREREKHVLQVRIQV